MSAVQAAYGAASAIRQHIEAAILAREVVRRVELAPAEWASLARALDALHPSDWPACVHRDDLGQVTVAGIPVTLAA